MTTIWSVIPQIENNQIVNIMQLIEAINSFEDLDYLKESLRGAYAQPPNIKGLDELRAALEIRIEALEQPHNQDKQTFSPAAQVNKLAEKIEVSPPSVNDSIGETEFNSLLGKLYMGENISKEERSKMLSFANVILDEMEAQNE